MLLLVLINFVKGCHEETVVVEDNFCPIVLLVDLVDGRLGALVRCQYLCMPL